MRSFFSAFWYLKRFSRTFPKIKNRIGVKNTPTIIKPIPKLVNGICKSAGIVPFSANVELSVVFVGETMQVSSEQTGLISHEVSLSAHVRSGLGVVLGQPNSTSSGF